MGTTMTDSNHPGARALLTPRWIITSILVIAAVALMVWLGTWQLDRHQQRSAFNQRVSAQMNAPALALNEALASGSLESGELLAMEYRPVQVSGSFDPQHEVILRNQVLDGRPGYHVFTPLRIDGLEQAVLVDRGFIPMEARTPADRAQYAQSGPAEVQGILRLAVVPRFFGAPDPALAPGETRRDAWNALRIDRIQSQVPYPLLPVYVQSAPDSSTSAASEESASVEQAGFPVASLDRPELSEGSHMGYALQWFTFAALLAVGYPFFVRRQLRRG
jgi:surfeit locus 1 family protein